jgi:hypothetical protein
MKKSLFLTLIIALTFTACPPEPNPTHTHSYAAAWSNDATQHWHECSCGEKTDVAYHTAGDWIIDQAATETTAGSQHKECTVCGYETATETIPATPVHTHTYSTTWSKDATQHWHECSCGEKTDVATHDWQWKVTTPATTEADGLETETCTTCGATRGTKPIAKLETEKTQHSPDVPMFADKTATITTADTFTDTQWNAIVTAIAGKFETAYNEGNVNLKGAYENALQDSITIIVEKNPTAYTNYKVSGYTLWVHAVEGTNNMDTNAIVLAIINATVLIDGETPPQFREATINLTFEENTYTATVQATLLEAEWTGGATSVPAKIETTLNTRFATSGTATQGMFNTVFNTGVTIVVEKNPEYTNYKADSNQKTIYINFGVLNDEGTLWQAVGNATAVLAGRNVPITG